MTPWLTHDRRLVVSRLLLLGLLAAYIGTVYLGVVYGLGALLDRTADDLTLSLLATIVVALAAEPVRRRLERAANRLVFGQRSTPYEVLADLSSRLGRAETTAGLLDRTVQRLAEATGAQQTVLWRWSDPGYEPLVVWPETGAVEPRPSLSGHLAMIERSGTRLGALTVTKRQGEELTSTEQRLLEDLAGSAGLVLDKARLDAALTDQAARLFESRRRLVDAQSDERQRLERQLHEGTQRQLVGLRTALGGDVDRARAEGADKVAEQLAGLQADTATAVEEIEALARGVYPPLLERDGLGRAIGSLADSLPASIVVDARLDRRLDLDAELAVYFCVVEALTNVVKHAQATTTTVTIGHDQDQLWFRVSDDGVGIEASGGDRSGTGVTGIGDRLEAIGGVLRVESTPGGGTTVSGHLPAG